MKKPKYPYRIAILMGILTIPPIGATQLGWYLYDQQTGFDYGMIIGTFSVILAAWLMYEKAQVPLQNCYSHGYTYYSSNRSNSIRLVPI